MRRIKRSTIVARKALDDGDEYEFRKTTYTDDRQTEELQGHSQGNLSWMLG